MSFSVRLSSANHRPDIFAEIEYDGELVAEAFVESGQLMIALTDPGGKEMWAGPENDLLAALQRARISLRDAGLLT